MSKTLWQWLTRLDYRLKHFGNNSTYLYFLQNNIFNFQVRSFTLRSLSSVYKYSWVSGVRHRIRLSLLFPLMVYMFLKQPKWTARNRMWESSNPTEDTIQSPSNPDGPCSLPLLRDQITHCYSPSIRAMEEQHLIKENIVSSCSQWLKNGVITTEGFTIGDLSCPYWLQVSNDMSVRKKGLSESWNGFVEKKPWE